MPRRQTITLVAKEKVAETFLCGQLREMLGMYLDIQGICLNDAPGEVPPNDLVVISNRNIREQAMSFLAPGNRVIVARRALNHGNFDKLVGLPAGTRALLVSNLLSSAEDTIRLLGQLGIDHLELIPYCPGMGPVPPGVTVAITPGAPHLVPSSIKRVIDIGVRTIALSTIAEICLATGISFQEIDNGLSWHTREMVIQSRELCRTLDHLSDLKNQLETILDAVHDGIIALNREGEVTVFNPGAEELFDKRRAEVIGRSVNRIWSGSPLLETLNSGQGQMHDLQNIRGKKIVCTRVPIKSDDRVMGVVGTLKDVTEIQKLEEELRGKLREQGHIAKYSFADIIGQSPVIFQTVARARRLAGNHLNLLLLGENGTGKELFAQAIHNASPRKIGPFVAFNFAALPESLLESELFGYEEGAFTGARKGGKPGLFEQAHNGTLFIDEIGDASLAMQARLLRVLQEKQVLRVGGTRIIEVNVRVIAATNKDLSAMTREGSFRSDLYYRLNVLSLRIPPLRERKEDIPALLAYFLSRYPARRRLSREVAERLHEHDWPGNVRELENVVEYMANLASGDTITLEDMPETLLEEVSAAVQNGPEEMELVRVKSLLQSRGRLEEFFFLLRELYQSGKDNAILGRDRLAERSLRTATPLTAEKVKSRLRVLKELGCLKSGITRQGTTITEKGIRLLEFANQA